jgi:3-oxoacyl-[acyl-carrier-protein] synthase-3
MCGLGLLIYTGIYRHKNTGEPSIAALIQEKISSGRTAFDDSTKTQNTFSFDINNGGCGLLTGIEIVHRSLVNKEISFGMTVAGDSEPFHGLSKSFNFNASAAAIILSLTEGSRGFSLFRTYTYPEYSEELVSRTFYSIPTWKKRGQNILNVSQRESYPDLCVELAVKSLYKFLDESGILLKEIDLLIGSQSPLKFTGRLKARLGMNENFVEISQNGEKTFHTAGPAFALKKAWDDDRFKSAKNIIFLTIGSGIKVSVALYRN